MAYLLLFAFTALLGAALIAGSDAVGGVGLAILGVGLVLFPRELDMKHYTLPEDDRARWIVLRVLGVVMGVVGVFLVVG